MLITALSLFLLAVPNPTPLPKHGPSTWSTTPPTGIADAERRAFESLPLDKRMVLTNSVEVSKAVAARVSVDLHGAVVALADNQTRVVDEQYRVKAVESLSRKYLEACFFEELSPEDYLSRVKDRVRFSVETPAPGYGATVSGVLARLHQLHYRPTQTASFWADHGRHNGLNAWLTDPDGFRIEIQFPTPLSRAIGKDTHNSYEILRFGGSHPYDRVNAFLEILAVNKERDIYGARPSDLYLVQGLRTKESTLTSWLRSDQQFLEDYRETLSEHGISLEMHLQLHGLERGDVPGIEEVGLI